MLYSSLISVTVKMLTEMPQMFYKGLHSISVIGQILSQQIVRIILCGWTLHSITYRSLSITQCMNFANHRATQRMVHELSYYETTEYNTVPSCRRGRQSEWHVHPFGNISPIICCNQLVHADIYLSLAHTLTLISGPRCW